MLARNVVRCEGSVREGMSEKDIAISGTFALLNISVLFPFFLARTNGDSRELIINWFLRKALLLVRSCGFRQVTWY